MGSKTTNYLSLGLQKERPSYRRSLKRSSQKRPSNTSKHELLKKNFYLWVIFALLDPLTQLNPDPQPWIIVHKYMLLFVRYVEVFEASPVDVARAKEQEEGGGPSRRSGGSVARRRGNGGSVVSLRGLPYR